MSYRPYILVYTYINSTNKIYEIIVYNYGIPIGKFTNVKLKPCSPTPKNQSK